MTTTIPATVAARDLGAGTAPVPTGRVAVLELREGYDTREQFAAALDVVRAFGCTPVLKLVEAKQHGNKQAAIELYASNTAALCARSAAHEAHLALVDAARAAAVAIASHGGMEALPRPVRETMQRLVDAANDLGGEEDSCRGA